MKNPDAEAEIEELINKLAYERVKHSYLFNVLSNEQVDRKSTELAAKIAPVVETWIMTEVEAEAERQNELDEFVAASYRRRVAHNRQENGLV